MNRLRELDSLYSILNNDAKSWWWFKQLRAQGKFEEARSLERKSILSTVKTLRHAWHLSIGDYGMSLSCKNENGDAFNKQWTLSGGNSDFYLMLARRLNIPWSDKREITFDSKMQVISMPSPSKETLDEYFVFIRSLGGKTSNITKPYSVLKLEVNDV